MRALRVAATLLGLLLPSMAWAQATVLQAGPWAPGHVPVYVGNGSSQPVVMDGGPAGGGGVGTGASEIGLVSPGTGTPPYANGGTGPFGTNVCDYDAPITNATGYHYLCFGPNADGGGLIAYGAAGSATQLPLTLNINGTPFTFPGTGIGDVAGPGSSTVGDLAVWNNTAGTLLKDSPLGTGVLTALGVTSNTVGGLVSVPNTDSCLYQNSASAVAGCVVPNSTLQFDGSGELGLTSQSANSVLGNATESSAVPTALSIPSCSTSSSALIWTTSGGFGCHTISGGGSGTVTSISQTFTGGLISVAGSPITTSGTLALTIAGTSGGIPYFSSATGWASSAALTANKPVIGGGAGTAPTVGTASGSTTEFATASGTLTSGDCVSIDGSGNFVDAGGACTTGGGGGTVSSGSVNQLARYASTGTTVSGLTTANNGVLITSGAGVPSISSTIPAATQANITTVGTVGTGTWQGTLVSPTFGGSGVSNPTAHGVLLAEGSSAFTSLAIGTAGRLLVDQGAAADPAFASMSGDCTFASSGAITCTHINGVALTLGAALTTTGTGAPTLAFGGTSATYTYPGATDTLAGLSKVDQTLAGGANLTPFNPSAGNYTVDCGKNPAQWIANTSAFTLTAPASDGECVLQIENGSGAGTVTFSGFSEGSNTGDALDTTNGHKFQLSIIRIHSISHYLVSALQ